MQCSTELVKHLKQLKLPPACTLESAGISDRLTTYIRNLQEKTVGNGCFCEKSHRKVLQRVKKIVKRKISLYLDKTLFVHEDIVFSFSQKKLTLFSPKSLNITRHDDNEKILTFLCITVNHKDEDDRTWEHDLCIIICQKVMYHFDFNDHGHYTEHLKFFFESLLTGFTFKSVFDLSVLFPEAFEKSQHIAVQSDNGNDYCCTIYNEYLKSQCKPLEGVNGIENMIRTCSVLSGYKDIAAMMPRRMFASEQKKLLLTRSIDRLKVVDEFVEECFRGVPRDVKIKRCTEKTCPFLPKGHIVFKVGPLVRAALHENAKQVAAVSVRIHKDAIAAWYSNKRPLEDAVPMCCTRIGEYGLIAREDDFLDSPIYNSNLLSLLPLSPPPPESPKLATARDAFDTPEAECMPTSSARTQRERGALSQRQVCRRLATTLPRSSRRGERRTRAALPQSWNKLFWPKTVLVEALQQVTMSGKTLHLLSQSPRIWQIPSFIDAKELAYFKALCNDNVFQPSFVQAENGDREVNGNRTSTFCPLFGHADKVVKKIQTRAARIVGYNLPSFIEPLQLVKYVKGQHFNLHHDAGVYDQQSGTVTTGSQVRVASFFVYLNDLPEGSGGRTIFPQADLKVEPSAGTAILWSNVKNFGDTSSLKHYVSDPLVVHSGERINGNCTKFAFNIWVCVCVCVCVCEFFFATCVTRVTCIFYVARR